MLRARQAKRQGWLLRRCRRRFPARPPAPAGSRRDKRRLRSRAQECKRLAESSHSAETAKHYHLISKQYLTLAHFFFTEKHSAPPPIAKEKTGAPIPRLSFDASVWN